MFPSGVRNCFLLVLYATASTLNDYDTREKIHLIQRPPLLDISRHVPEPLAANKHTGHPADSR